MSEQELLQTMLDAYFSASGPSDIPFGLEMSAMRAVLDVLHKAGYRRCAEGQGSTQWCAAWEQADKACRDLTEKVIPNIRERSEKAEAEVERLRADYGNACKAVVQAHAAATGRPGEGPFLGVIEDVAAVRAERDALRERNAEWERKASAWMASPQAVQRLDGYRELAQRLNAAETERDALRAVIEAAPHDEDCQSVINTGPITRYGVATCNCWKAARGES